ncbi:CRISPR-associated DxTHG motif protein [Collinsella sp. TM09-10AT]|nr:CRISPR-associated DxTHG motif protein [Collinsella sp. TM09-10AT]
MLHGINYIELFTK